MTRKKGAMRPYLAALLAICFLAGSAELMAAPERDLQEKIYPTKKSFLKRWFSWGSGKSDSVDTEPPTLRPVAYGSSMRRMAS